MSIAVNELSDMLSINRHQAANAHNADPAVLAESGQEALPGYDVLLDNMVKDGEQALKIMEKSLEGMQENFVDTLRLHLSKLGINLDERIVLSMTESGELLMEGAFSGIDDLEKISGVSRRFNAKFRAMSTMATMINNLEQACAVLRTSVEAEDSAVPRYRACLKGSLSHFYTA